MDSKLYKSLSWESKIYPVYNYLSDEETSALEDILYNDSLFRKPRVRSFDSEGNLVTRYSDVEMYSFATESGEPTKIDSPRSESPKLPVKIHGDVIISHEMPSVIESLKLRIYKEFDIEAKKVIVEKFKSGPEIHPLKYIKFNEAAIFSFCRGSCVHLRSRRSRETIAANISRGTGIFIKDGALNDFDVMPRKWRTKLDSNVRVVLSFIN